MYCLCYRSIIYQRRYRRQIKLCIKRWGHSSLLACLPNLHGAQVPSPQQGEKRKGMWRKACPPGTSQPSALQKSPKACHLRCLWRCHCTDRTANGLSSEARQACLFRFLPSGLPGRGLSGIPRSAYCKGQMQKILFF